MRGFQAGNVDGFEVLFLRYQRPIFNYLYRMIGRPGPAEDLTQDVFLRVFSSLGRSDEIANFRAWLYKVATNVAISALRKDHTTSVSLEDRLGSNAIAEPADERPGPEALHLRHESAAEVATALQQLPERHRQALVLRQLQGLSYQEMAEVMDLSLEAVTSLLHRARLDFRSIFEGLSKKASPARKGNRGNG